MPPHPKRSRRTEETITPQAVASTPDATTAATTNRHAAIPDSIMIQPIMSDLATILMVDLLATTPDTVAAALERLHDLLTTDDPHGEQSRLDACAMGVHGLLCPIMRKWDRHQLVQEWGCFCIQSLSYLDAYEDSFIQCFAVEIVLSSLRAFPQCLSIQWGGCGALRNLLSSFESASTVKLAITKKFVDDYDGLATVVTAMERFSDDPDMTVECCILFQNLAASERFRVAMIAADVPMVVAAALKTHRKNKQVTKEAKECMHDLFATDA